MKNNNRKILKKVKTAFENQTPHVLESVLARCHEMDCSEKGKVITMTRKKTFKPLTKAFIAMAACFALIVVGSLGYTGYRHNYTVASTISFDVNPSLEIKVNEQEKVLEVLPLNEDAKTVIGTMDFRGSSLELTVNALVGSMLTKGYLNDVTNSILISVDGKNDTTALREKLTAEVASLLHTDSFDGSVITQSLKGNAEIKKLASDYGITVGKAQLIDTIIEANPGKTFESLVPLSITELNLLLDRGAPTTDDSINVEGNASNKAYISKEQAYEAVLNHLEITEDKVIDLEIELEAEKGVICYEIEFECPSLGSKHEYYVNAVTGQIVSGGSKYTSLEPTPTAPSADRISKEDAISAALQKAQITNEDAYGLNAKLDRDDGAEIYEVEFKAGGYEYEIEVDALTGEVVGFDREKLENSKSADSDKKQTADTITKEKAIAIALEKA